MRPIPRGLLIHDITLCKIASEDRWGKGELGADKEILFVRIEPSSKVVRDKNNKEIQLAATLFFDCRNSSPRGIEFAVDDIVLFNKQKYKVQMIDPLYDGKRLHHYEIGLIKHA